MRREMNEKLRLSAKEQAMQATRRLDLRHKKTLKQLRNQIKTEQARAKQRQDELVDRISQQHISAESEHRKMEQRLHTVSLEKDKLLSEMDLLNERVKEMQQQRFGEWTAEHDASARAHRASMEELEEQKRVLQRQTGEVSAQKDAFTAKERRYASLEQERNNLLGEIEDLRRQHAEVLKMQQSSFRQTQSKLQIALIKSREELEASRSEAAGVRSLLKQSHACLEAVSFREIGSATRRRPSPGGGGGGGGGGATAAGAAVSPWRPSSRLLAPSPTHDVPRTAGIVPRISSADGRATRGVAPWRRPSLTEPSPTTHRSDSKTHPVAVRHTSRFSTNTQDQESLLLVRQKVDTPPAISGVGEDPPCSSAEDPPEMAESHGVASKNNRLAQSSAG